MRVYAIREFNYGGEQRERGEVFELQGLRNDSLLLREDGRRVGLIRPVEQRVKTSSLPNCDGCAKVFMDESYKLSHYEGRIHPESPNYSGPEARVTGEQPTPREASLKVGNKANVPLTQFA